MRPLPAPSAHPQRALHHAQLDFPPSQANGQSSPRPPGPRPLRGARLPRAAGGQPHAARGFKALARPPSLPHPHPASAGSMGGTIRMLLLTSLLSLWAVLGFTTAPTSSLQPAGVRALHLRFDAAGAAANASSSAGQGAAGAQPLQPPRQPPWQLKPEPQRQLQLEQPPQPQPLPQQPQPPQPPQPPHPPQPPQPPQPQPQHPLPPLAPQATCTFPIPSLAQTPVWGTLPIELGVEAGAPPAPPHPATPAAFHSSAHLYSPPAAAVMGQAALAALAARGCSRADSDSPTLLRVYEEELMPAAASSSNSSAPAAPLLPPGLPLEALLRTPQEAAQRHLWAAACYTQHPSYAQFEGYSSRLHHGREMAPEEAFLSQRTTLAAHGGTLYARLTAFARQHGLHQPADWRYTTGHSGPWVEDIFRATFFKGAAYRISLARAQARARYLAAAGVADEGAGYVLFSCAEGGFARSGEGSLEAFQAGAASGVCQQCVVGVEVLLAAGGVEALGCEHDGGDWGEGVRHFAQLFLTLPYDSELFYPLVPIPPFWENLMFTVSTAATLAADLLTLPTGAWQLEMGKIRPSLYTASPTLIQDFQQLLLSATRKDVHYITVVQRPDGPWVASQGNYERATMSIAALCHTVVINSGGNGHIPIPLLHAHFPMLPVYQSAEWLQGVQQAGGPGSEAIAAAAAAAAAVPAPPPHPLSAASPSSNATTTPTTTVPPHTRLHSGFFGDAATTPPLSFFGMSREGLRMQALDTLKATVPRFTAGRLGMRDMSWIAAFVNSTLAFAPRGVGATSFRLYEALQLGMPSVFAYDDRPWLAYLHPEHIPSVGFRAYPPQPFASPLAQHLPPPPATPFPWNAILHAVEIEGLHTWALERLPRLVPGGSAGEEAQAREAWLAMRQAMQQYKHSHFTQEGVMRHIWRLVADPWSAELFCYPAKRPETSMY